MKQLIAFFEGKGTDRCFPSLDVWFAARAAFLVQSAR